MFLIGEKYPREKLLIYVGSRQSRSGIIWGPKKPDCVIVTSGGRHSEKAGYQDERKSDGSWIYFGQGRSGDQDPNRFSNRLLIDQMRSILLFSTKEPTTEEFKASGNYSKGYRFEGIFNVLSWDVVIPSEGTRAGHRLLRFHLVPPPDQYHFDSIEEYSLAADNSSLAGIREASLNYGSRPAPVRQSLQEYRQASNLIKKYAMLRAGGICECCEKAAPFMGTNGYPFLEVHHIFRLTDDGPDSPFNVAALCPNCHREAHFGSNQGAFREALASKIRMKEQVFEEVKG